jgi:hypothetical protein
MECYRHRQSDVDIEAGQCRQIFFLEQSNSESKEYILYSEKARLPAQAAQDEMRP